MIIKKKKLLLLLLFITISIQAQVNISVKINSGSNTTTCTDTFPGGGPEPVYGVTISGQGEIYYGDSGACFYSLPNTQYNETFNCPTNLPTNLQVSLNAFEEDGISSCVFTKSCSETNLQNFPVPALGGTSSYTLNVGGTSTATINFTIQTTGTWPLGGSYDTICNSINLGTLSPNNSLGNNGLSNYGNFCATSTGDPHPWGGNNDQGVWFQFTTSSTVSNEILFNAMSDPQGAGDTIDLQLSLYQSSNNTCTGSLTHVQESYEGLGQPSENDESMTITCLTPNTTYFLLVDGESTPTINPNGNEGYFGIQIDDNTIDNSVTTIADTITASASGYSYQWIDCNDSNTPISGETNQSYTATSIGSYAVQISNGTCFITSDCENIAVLAITDNNLSNGINIYPNPTNGKVFMQLKENHNTITTNLYSITGKKLSVRNFTNTSTLEINIDNKPGVYFLEIQTPKNKSIVKLIKK